MATEDKVSVPSEEKTKMSERESQWPNTPAKWIELLGTPLTILVAAGTLLFSVYQFNAQQQSDSQNAVQQQQLARQQEAATQAQTLDQQRQTTLDTYLDRMSDLLLTYHLAASKPGDQSQAIAVARTFTALRNLDGTRKGYLIKFLWDAQLIKEPHVILQMPGADLSNAVFAIANQHPNLSSISLISDILYHADLSGVILAEANLSKAYLGGADLSNTNLEGTNLNSANLSGINLQGAIYNSGPIQIPNAQGGVAFTLQATQWPQGFDPKVAGACDFNEAVRTQMPCPGRAVLIEP